MIKAIIALCCMAAMYSCGGNKDVEEYFDEPIVYEDGKTTSFKVFQVIDPDAALASESSSNVLKLFNGKVVLLLGSSFYDEQIIKVEDPMQVGIYRYETKSGDIKTVPIIDTEFWDE